MDWRLFTAGIALTAQIIVVSIAVELAFVVSHLYTKPMNTSAQVKAAIENGTLLVSVGGDWQLEAPWPSEAEKALAEMDASTVRALKLTASNLGRWDSSLLLFLTELARKARAKDIKVEMSLPEGVMRLIHMVFAVPPRQGAGRGGAGESFLARVGDAALRTWPRICDFLSFLGEIAYGLGRLFSGRSRMRLRDLLFAMYECGISSLPIIALTSMLFGLILAFVGAVQLTQFGAQVYVAGLVGIGMLRVMGAVMVGVVMSGRIGAAYAALIGTMQVNEEVDALAVLGISPIDFLVMPRVAALTLMVPLLTIYADFMGLVGGYLVGIFMLDLNSLEYIHATAQMVSFRQILIGLVYGSVFGLVIAICGCYQGMRCGRSAMAVGQTTTRAVVASLVGIIVMTAIITVICNVLDV